MSYGAEPTVMNLHRVGTTLIVGEDLDNTSSGSGANGVGKTVWLNALTYALYDKPVSNISKDNLVNNINKKNMQVEVTFQKGDLVYQVRRVRKEKSYAAGNYVQLFENGKDITPDSVSNTNKAIETIIGMPYELFVRIVVFPATGTPFLDLPARHPTGPNQTDIIEELFDLKTLSAKANLLKEQIKDGDLKIQMLEQKVKLLEEERNRHQTQINAMTKRVIDWEKNRKQDINNLQTKLDKISGIDIDQQAQYNDEYSAVLVEVNKLTAELKDIDRKLKTETKRVKDLTKEHEHLSDDNCPYCKQHYADAAVKASELQSKIEELNFAINDLEVRRDTIDKQLDERQQTADQLGKNIVVSNIKELYEIKSKSSEYKKRIENLEKEDCPFLEPLEELENMEFEEISYDDLNNAMNFREHQKFLLKLLTKKDSFVRRTLLTKTLPFLNQRLQHYLTNLGLVHHVEFTQEMTAKITQFGREMDFGNLSNGQRARVNLALSFAFRDVLQNLHGTINICMLDEVLDVGLDTVGITAAARLLKKKARDEKLSLYIISHRDEIGSTFDNVLTVQLKEGFSRIAEG